MSKRRAIITVTAVQRDAANKLLESKGFGPNNFSIPLLLKLSRSDALATHYTCGWTMTDGEKAEIVQHLNDAKIIHEWQDQSSGDPLIATPKLEDKLIADGRKLKPISDLLSASKESQESKQKVLKQKANKWLNK